MAESGTVRRAWWKLRFRTRRAFTDARIVLEQRRLHRRYERETSRRTAEVLRRFREERGLLLNIGASNLHIDGWVSVDLRPDERGIRFDASQPWPLADACARAVRSEHLIEHLDLDGARTCLRETLRVLEPGGVCRTVTPDLQAIARAYLERDPRVLEVHREHGYEAPTWSHFMNNYMRLWGHRYLFDLDALSTLLAECGFGEIERAPFGESRHVVLAGTDAHDAGELRHLLLCVDAVKPVAP